MLLADRGYDADWIRALVNQQGAWANIPPRRNRKEPICFSPYLYRARNLVERFFNKIKQCRRIATLPRRNTAVFTNDASGCKTRRLEMTRSIAIGRRPVHNRRPGPKAQRSIAQGYSRRDIRTPEDHRL